MIMVMMMMITAFQILSLNCTGPCSYNEITRMRLAGVSDAVKNRIYTFEQMKSNLFYSKEQEIRRSK
jgi:hypothetical protein